MARAVAGGAAVRGVAAVPQRPGATLVAVDALGVGAAGALAIFRAEVTNIVRRWGC